MHAAWWRATKSLNGVRFGSLDGVAAVKSKIKLVLKSQRSSIKGESNGSDRGGVKSFVRCTHEGKENL